MAFFPSGPNRAFTAWRAGEIRAIGSANIDIRSFSIKAAEEVLEIIRTGEQVCPCDEAGNIAG